MPKMVRLVVCSLLTSWRGLSIFLHHTRLLQSFPNRGMPVLHKAENLGNVHWEFFYMLLLIFSMCVYVYLCVFVSMYVCICLCVSMYVCVPVYICILVCLCVCICIFLFVSISIVCFFVYQCLYLCLCICMYVSICIHGILWLCVYLYVFCVGVCDGLKMIVVGNGTIRRCGLIGIGVALLE